MMTFEQAKEIVRPHNERLTKDLRYSIFYERVSVIARDLEGGMSPRSGAIRLRKAMKQVKGK